MKPSAHWRRIRDASVYMAEFVSPHATPGERPYKVLQKHTENMMHGLFRQLKSLKENRNKKDTRAWKFDTHKIY